MRTALCCWNLLKWIHESPCALWGRLGSILYSCFFATCRPALERSQQWVPQIRPRGKYQNFALGGKSIFAPPGFWVLIELGDIRKFDQNPKLSWQAVTDMDETKNNDILFKRKMSNW